MVANLFMPLYAGPEGAKPEVDEALSAAELRRVQQRRQDRGDHDQAGAEVGQRRADDGNDLAFEYYLLKAAVTESPANWGQFAPGVFPLNVASVKVSGQTVTFTLDNAVNPGWFLNNNVSDTDNVYPLPSTAWNIAAAGGPHLDFTNPANAKKIYDYLAKQGASVCDIRDQPAVAGRQTARSS